MSDRDPTIEVSVEYDEFIAGRELCEIIDLLDEELWDAAKDILKSDISWYKDPTSDNLFPPPIFCIYEVNKGSLLIVGLIGGAAAKYCFDRFKKGLRSSDLGPALEQLGKELGNNLGTVIDRLNNSLRRYTEKAKLENSRIKRIKARKK